MSSIRRAGLAVEHNGSICGLPNSPHGLITRVFWLLKIPLWALSLHLDLCLWLTNLNDIMKIAWKPVNEAYNALWWDYYCDSRLYWATHVPAPPLPEDETTTSNPQEITRD